MLDKPSHLSYIPVCRAIPRVLEHAMGHRILNYRTENAARGAMKRLLKRYPVHPDCRVEIVFSPSWLFPFRYLIRVTGRDNSFSYWSAAR